MDNINITTNRFGVITRIKNSLGRKALRVSEIKLNIIKRKSKRTLSKIDKLEREISQLEAELNQELSLNPESLRIPMLEKEIEIAAGKLLYEQNKQTRYNKKVESQKIKLPSNLFDNIILNRNKETSMTRPLDLAAKNKTLEVSEEELDEIVNRQGESVLVDGEEKETQNINKETGDEKSKEAAFGRIFDQMQTETEKSNVTNNDSSKTREEFNIDVPIEGEIKNTPADNQIEPTIPITPDNNNDNDKYVEVRPLKPSRVVVKPKKIIKNENRVVENPVVENPVEERSETNSIQDLLKMAQQAKEKQSQLNDTLAKEKDTLDNISQANKAQEEVNKKRADYLKTIIEQVNNQNKDMENEINNVISLQQQEVAEKERLSREETQLNDMLNEFAPQRNDNQASLHR